MKPASRMLAPDEVAHLKRRLAEGASRLGVSVSEDQCDTLIRFIALLAKWNQVYNLTGIRDPRQMVTLHLLDSLAVSRFVINGPVLDVGSGAGIPGLVLAVTRPALRYVLLDSSRKKARFCLQAVAELGLENVDVVHQRLEEYRPEERYRTLLLRAFGSLRGRLVDLRRLSESDARVLAMMGKAPQIQNSDVAQLRECAKVMPLTVPDLEAERNLLLLDMACVEQLAERV